MYSELDDIIKTNVVDVEGDEVFSIEKAISIVARMKVSTKHTSMLKVKDKKKETTEKVQKESISAI